MNYTDVVNFINNTFSKDVMRILIIFAHPPLLKGVRMFNFGIAYISSALKRANHKTFLLNLDKFDPKSLDLAVNKYNPQLLFFSCSTDQIDIVKESANYLKKYNIPLIIGGTHATVFPEDALNIEGIIGICIGEGEEVVVEFVKTLEKGKNYSKIRNFWFKKNNKIIKNELRPLIENLDSLPFADREIFDYSNLLKNHKEGYEFVASRGCAYKCSFCVYPQLQKMYQNKGKFVRYRSVDNLLEEIKQVTEKYKTNNNFITFHDDIFTYDKKWLTEFCEKYSQQVALPFRCNVRADRVDEEVFKLLKKANCDQIWIGVESGDEYVRNKILKKHVKDKQIIKAFNLAKKYQIKSMAFTMIGIPFETEEQIKKTLEFTKKIDCEIKSVNVFRPYPGTELYDICKEKGWISNRHVEGYHDETILDQPSISAKRINYYREIFYPALTNSRWLPLIKILVKIRIRNASLYSYLKKIKHSLYK